MRRLVALTCLAFVLATALWSYGVYRHFEHFALRNDATTSGLQLGRLAQDSMREWLRWLHPGAPASSELTSLTLTLADEDQRKLGSDLPYSGRRFVPAQLTASEPGSSKAESWKVDVRYRGDLYVHWGRAKKSWRVRTERSSLFRGMRKFNLVAPKSLAALNNHLTAWLADELGLLAPRTDLVRLRVNGRDRGVHVLVEQIDETLLRARQRMPGGIFSGEAFLRDAWHGVPNELFARAGIWKQSEKRDRPHEARRAPLERLLADLRAPHDAARAKRIARMLDLERFAALSLLERLTQSSHLDLRHNWRLAWDEWTRRFEPIVWDLVGWHDAWRPAPGQQPFVHPAWTTLHDALHSELAFRAERERAIRAFFERGLDAQLLQRAQRCSEILEREMSSDASRLPASSADEAGARTRFVDFVRTTTQALRAEQGVDDDVTWARTERGFRLALRSERAIPSLDVVLGRAHEVERAELLVRRDGRSESVEISSAITQRGDTLHLAVPLAATLERHLGFDGVDPVRNRRLVARRTTFEFDLGLDDAQIRELRAEGRARPLRRVANIELEELGALWLGAGFGRAATHWSGRRVIADRHVVQGPVTIAPGTRIELAPGATLVFARGVHAVGTARAPITFTGDAWAGVVLDGAACDGSRIEHCSFVGGIGARDELGTVSAALSLHAVRDVTLRACRFESGSSAEDGVHLVHASARMEDCVVRGGLDGVDCDLSTITLLRCELSTCRGDGLDLMESRAWVEDSEIERHGDKGISVGERSRALVVESLIARCSIGIEVKDGAEARLVHCSVDDCPRALRAAEKNWRYENGGTIFALRSDFARAPRVALLEGRSSIRIEDSRLPEDSPSKVSPGVRVDARSDRAQLAAGEDKSLEVPAAEQGVTRITLHSHRGRRAGAK